MNAPRADIASTATPAERVQQIYLRRDSQKEYEMQDLLGMLKSLRRPRLLIRTARIGAQDYNRDRHLQRILGYGTLPGPGPSLIRLLDMERGLDHQRRTDDAGYSLTRHLDVLIALMGEAQLFAATRPIISNSA